MTLSDGLHGLVPGTIRPHRTLVLLSAAHAINHAQAALLPFIFLAIIDRFDVSVADMAFLTAAMTIISGGAQLSYGWLTRYVSRRSILGWGNVLFGAAFAAASAASNFAAFGLALVVSRVGGSPQHPVGNSLLSEQFPAERRGLAISSHIAGGNLGTVAVPLVATALIATVGWEGTVLVFAIPAVLVGLAILGLVGESGSGRAAAIAHGSVRQAFRTVIRDRDQMLVLASSVIASGGRGLGALSLFVPLYLALVLELGSGTIAAMLTVLLLGSVPGPIVAGWLSDRLGRKPVIVSVYVAGAASLVLFVTAGSDMMLLWLGIVLMSAFSFVESPQLQSLLADIARPAIRDSAFAIYFTLVFVSSALWVAAYGGLIEQFGDPTGLAVIFILMALGYLLAALTVIPIRVRERTAEVRAEEAAIERWLDHGQN